MPKICEQCGKEHATKEELEEKANPPPKKNIKLKKAGGRDWRN
jgi:hypothetical protein